MRLADRTPEVDLSTLLQSFTPPPRFQTATFDTYNPDLRYASQAAAKERLRRWVRLKPRGWFRKAIPGPKGVYLDGGFGVGKTHLLVATYWDAAGPKAYLSFEELTYTIGLMGMSRAVDTFAQLGFLMIDEFELDDPGNAQMVTNFLQQTMRRGLRVVTTSNTPPGALGKGRFNAEQFRHQIQGLAAAFEVLHIEGEDYRHRDPAHPPALLSREALEARYAREARPATFDTFAALLAHLRTLHPIRYRYLFAGLEAVYIADLEPIMHEADALRFVHFVDKLYDLGLELFVSGVPLSRLFPETYRHGAYAKKYGRALSRLAELVEAAYTHTLV